MIEGSLWSLVPPAIVLFMGFYTRKVHLSLLSGVICSAVIASSWNPTEALKLTGSGLWDSLEIGVILNPSTFWDSWNSFICIFLIMLGILITMIHHSGGAWAYEKFIKSRLRDRKKVECSSLIMSKFLCIDDYFSSLTVGSVMHPITDSYKIPRAKLAFLVDAMAAPLAIICPVSSWVAAIVGFLRDNGVQSQAGQHTKILASPFLAYVNVIPFIVYSFVVIFGAWFIVLKGISFGFMGKHERHARETGNMFNGRENLHKHIDRSHLNGTEPSLTDFFVPVFVLIASVLSGILYSGQWALLPGGHRVFMDAMREASAAQGLLIGGSIALSCTLIFYLFRKKLAFKTIPKMFAEGLKLMGPSCLVLILAWTLGGLLRNHLSTGQYLAGLLVGNLPTEFLPAMAFIASIVISFSIGSAWGTAAIMFPIGVQMILTIAQVPLPATLEQIPLLFPTLGAILSGSVAGDHISPISDTTIMSSTSTAMEHIDHVETQMSYAIPLIIITGISYLIPGFCLSLGAGYAALLTCASSAALIFVVFSLLNQKNSKKTSD